MAKPATKNELFILKKTIVATDAYIGIVGYPARGGIPYVLRTMTAEPMTLRDDNFVDDRFAERHHMKCVILRRR